QDYAYAQMRSQNRANRYAIGYDEQSSIEPDVRVTSEFDLQQSGNIQAAGQIMGEVSVNFKSDVFPLEKLVDTDQLQKLTQAQGAVGKDFKAGAIREGVEQFGEMVKKVDFPNFVSGLVHGVFQAIVDASIQQMEAFSELLAATAKTAEQFAGDHISDAQARD